MSDWTRNGDMAVSRLHSGIVLSTAVVGNLSAGVWEGGLHSFSFRINAVGAGWVVVITGRRGGPKPDRSDLRGRRILVRQRS